MLNLKGIYLISDHSYEQHGTLVDILAELLRDGVCALQYRLPCLGGRTRQQSYQEAKDLKALCRRHHIPFIVNNDVALAMAVQADGVHLGQQDTCLASARRQLGKQAILGLSCQNVLARAEKGVAQGADYVSFGALFPSQTKRHTTPLNLQQATAYCAQITVPVCLIGGIAANNLSQAKRSGADCFAMIHALASSSSPRQELEKCLRILRGSKNA